MPVEFENVRLVMELLSYAVMLPGFGMSIDPADNAAPNSWMPPGLRSDVAIEKLATAFPDSIMSDPPSLI
ncbi:MAG TPA: hypothetical protein VF748_02070 [Candidatus Acidoferrum sp.]